jgi:hypothetical protein
MAVAMGSVAAAQSPSPDGTEQLIEVPEAGLALTVPGDWDVTVRMQALDPGSGLLGLSSPWRQVQVLEAWTALEYPDPGTGRCEVLLVDDAAPRPATLDAVVANDAQQFWNDADFDGRHVVADVVLPAGDASRVDVLEHDDDGDWHGSNYRLAVPGGVAWLMCIGFEGRPSDGWLSVAASLELLPEGPIPATPYRIAFADGWVTHAPTSQEAMSMLRSFAPELRPLVRARLIAEHPSLDQACRVVDHSVLVRRRTDFEQVGEAVTSDIIAAQADPRLSVVGSVALQLPSGPAGRVDLLFEDWLAISRYHFSDGNAWYYLQCGAQEPPDDRWLSVAETFEFLPQEA